MAEEWHRLEGTASRIVPGKYQGPLGSAVIAGTGSVLFAFHAWKLVDPGEGAFVLLFGTLVPMTLSVLLFLGGVLLRRTEYEALALRIGLWCLVGVILLAAISLLPLQEQTGGVQVGDFPRLLGVPATGGGVVGFLIGVYDAERIQTERRMAAERERAEELGRRLSVLNRVLRHDIRNDVNVIHGNAERILQGTDVEEAARTIRRKASKLHRMGENAREIESLLEGGEFPTEPIDVAALATSKAEDVERDYPGVEVERSTPPAAWASASPMIESAIENVVENAVEHNDSERPRLAVTVDVTARTVTLRIADNGPGLPAEEVAVLRRGRETDLEHGSGLGLWLANWIVTESGGEIDFEGNEPRGSVVTIRLPRSEPPEGAQ